MTTAYVTPPLLVPGDQVHTGSLYGGRWRTVEQVRGCAVPAHAPLCTVIHPHGWPDVPATHHGPGSYVWAHHAPVAAP